MSYSGRGLTLVEVIAIIILVIIIIFVVFVIATNPFSHSHDLARRTMCEAKMNGISKGLFTYANENGGCFPIAPHAPATEPGKAAVRYAPGMIGKHREDRPPASQPTDSTTTELSTTRNFWEFVRNGGSSPFSFICPASEDIKNDEDNPQDYWDFRKYSEVSYGYQVPYGRHGRPSPERDAKMVLAADKGPYGAALEAGKANPGTPKPGLNARAKDWKRWNSPNHEGDGQSMLYADGHVQWTDTPIAGVKNDNIYTRWSDATGGTDANPTPRIHGTPPTGTEAPFSDTDSLIYP